MSEIVVAADVASLSVMPAEQAELAVSEMLSRSYMWLSKAVASTNVPPMDAKEVRAYVYTLAEATRQRDLSKEIQEDAQEMARRADYALGKAIRAGQANGTVRTRGQGGGGQHVLGISGAVPGPSSSHGDKDGLKVATDFATHGELHGGAGGGGILALADEAPNPEQFEQALQQAKVEHNVSRANVVRKIRGEGTAEREALWAEARRLAEEERWASREINAKLRMYAADADFKKQAARRGITFPADAVVSSTRRLQSIDLINRAVLGAAATAEALEIASLNQVTPEGSRRE